MTRADSGLLFFAGNASTLISVPPASTTVTSSLRTSRSLTAALRFAGTRHVRLIRPLLRFHSVSIGPRMLSYLMRQCVSAGRTSARCAQPFGRPAERMPPRCCAIQP